MKIAHRHSGFTLIELLVVISIIAIIVGLSVPLLKSFGKSDAMIGASRQLLDDVERARQMAIGQHTTVYMVFVPTNFWNGLTSAQTNSTAGLTATLNLLDKQLTSYTFVSLHSAGDQPGQNTPHYLTPWQTLPDGAFIAQAKFAEAPNQYYPIKDPISGAEYDIYGFHVTNSIPFPTETNATPDLLYLPYIAFNYLGQLTFDGQNLAGSDEYIPLAKGSVIYTINPTTRALQFGSPSATEVPPTNSTSIAYSIIHVDHLTGRANLEYHKMGP